MVFIYLAYARANGKLNISPADTNMMRSVNINVIPKEGEDKVPVEVAGNVMVDIQSLFRHVGEYLISKELRLQNKIDSNLSDMFELFIDPSSGISLRSSPKISTSGIVDDALALLERTLISMGSGAGGYWIEDNYVDPRFRKLIADDIITLAEGLRDRFYIKFVADSVFDNVDIEKIEKYIAGLGMSYEDATCGVIKAANSKSGKHRGLRLVIGDDSARLSFSSPEAENEAAALADKTVITAGRIKFSEGHISEISGIGKTVPFEVVKFKRMISSEGDVSLTVPLEIDINFDVAKNEWVLKNEELGISVSKSDWDLAIMSFHDYFIFLWNEYTSKEESELSDEEKEVKGFLLGLVVTE